MSAKKTASNLKYPRFGISDADILKLAKIAGQENNPDTVKKIQDAFSNKDSDTHISFLYATMRLLPADISSSTKRKDRKIQQIQLLSEKLAEILLAYGHDIDGRIFQPIQFETVRGIRGVSTVLKAPDPKLSEVLIDTKSIAKQLQDVALATEHFLSHPNKGGQKGIPYLHKYTLNIARLYEDVSGLQFKFDIKGKVPKHNPSYDFVEQAVMFLNRLVRNVHNDASLGYSTKNLNTACAGVIKALEQHRDKKNFKKISKH